MLRYRGGLNALARKEVTVEKLKKVASPLSAREKTKKKTVQGFANGNIVVFDTHQR
jgi:hypothetical protein